MIEFNFATSYLDLASNFTDLRALSQRLPLLQTLALLLSLTPTAPHPWRPRAGLNYSPPFSTICLRIHCPEPQGSDDYIQPDPSAVI